MSVVQWTTGIQHIGIPTSDIETTIRFYEGLGFQTMHTNQVPANQAKVAFLQLGNLMIETYAEGGNGLDGAINHFALNCTDIQAAYAWICEQGYKVLSNGIEELPFWERVWLSLLSKDRIKNGLSSVNGNSNGTLPL